MGEPHFMTLVPPAVQNQFISFSKLAQISPSSIIIRGPLFMPVQNSLRRRRYGLCCLDQTK
jgi:hypothetical protein